MSSDPQTLQKVYSVWWGYLRLQPLQYWFLTLLSGRKRVFRISNQSCQQNLY